MEWKYRRNKVSGLSFADFVQNTIDEETKEVIAEQVGRDLYYDEVADIKEGYYRAIAILNEVIWMEYAIYSIPDNTPEKRQKQLLTYIFTDIATARQSAIENGLDNFEIIRLLKDGVCERVCSITRSGLWVAIKSAVTI